MSVDLAGYKAALSALNNRLPAVPEAVAAVAAQGDAFRTATATLLAACSEHEKQAEEMLGQLTRALSALGTLAATQAQQVHDGGEATEKAAQDWCGALQEHETALETAVTGLGGSVDAFQTHLVNTVSALKTAHGTAHTALDDLDKAADEAGTALDKAVEDLKPAGTALAAAVASASDAIATEVSDFTAALSNGVEEAETRLELTIEQMVAQQDLHSDALYEQRNAIEQALSSLDESYNQRLAKDVLEPVEQAGEGVTLAVKGLAEDAGTMRDFSRAACQGFGERLTALQEAMAPMPGGVQNVADAAQQVGLPWGG